MGKHSKVESQERSVTEKQAAYMFSSGKHWSVSKKDLKRMCSAETVLKFQN